VLSLTYSLADQDFQRTKSLGIFNFSLQCLRHLARHSELDALEVLSNSSLPLPADLPGKTRIRLHDEAIAGRLPRAWWDQWGVYQAARRAGNPWLFLPKGFASFLRPCPVKLAVYVHDTILESYYANRPGLSSLELAYFYRCMTATLRHARVIFTNSEFTSRELERAAQRRGIKVPRLVSVGMGFDAPVGLTQQREDRILVLAGSFPHKRTDLALAYLAQWQARTNYSGSLEWVGRLPPGLSLPAYANWKAHSRLSEPEFRQLMAASRILVFFSDYEGFGMPPVEAILHGTCPVYSDLPATREVMAGTGCIFQNDSYETFASALAAALKTPPATIESWKQSLLQRFDWSRVCDRIVQTLGAAEP